MRCTRRPHLLDLVAAGDGSSVAVTVVAGNGSCSSNSGKGKNKGSRETHVDDSCLRCCSALCTHSKLSPDPRETASGRAIPQLLPTRVLSDLWRSLILANPSMKRSSQACKVPLNSKILGEYLVCQGVDDHQILICAMTDIANESRHYGLVYVCPIMERLHSTPLNDTRSLALHRTAYSGKMSTGNWSTRTDCYALRHRFCGA